MNDTLLNSARAWIADDPDPVTTEAGERLLESGDMDLIRSHFAGRLAFGTAGLRGALGPGPNRMNRALVLRVASAVGRYVEEHVDGAHGRGVVVAYDGRHGSEQFATDSVEILGALGYRVYLFETVIPTPRLAHAVKHLQAAAGIMVTASHNPPQDNGYKVFWGDGAQIVPPHDTGISDQLDRITDSQNLPRRPIQELRAEKRVQCLPDAVHAAYWAEVDALRVYSGPSHVRIVYTAMHGVGLPSIREVLTRHGYTDFHPVTEQADPDPDFPTVAFPNPEEPGAMDLSLKLAQEIQADLILANDPDADRLCVAVPDGDGFRVLTGNDVGILLADELLAHGEYSRPLVATTIVSTSMLEKIADHYGAAYRETLTGFKWIAERSIVHQADGGDFVVGFEEALGYSVGHVVRDKDGVSAALLLADIAARCRSTGISMLERLEAVYRRHGLHLTKQVSLKRPGESGQAEIAAIMERFRNEPPKSVAGIDVVRRRDLDCCEELDCISGKRSRLDLPRSNVLGFWLSSGARIMVRPSGTEPKIKFYFEVCEPYHDGEQTPVVESRGQAQLRTLEEAFMLLL